MCTVFGFLVCVSYISPWTDKLFSPGILKSNSRGFQIITLLQSQILRGPKGASSRSHVNSFLVGGSPVITRGAHNTDFLNRTTKLCARVNDVIVVYHGRTWDMENFEPILSLETFFVNIFIVHCFMYKF